MTQLIVLLRGDGTAEECRRTTDALTRHTTDLEIVRIDPKALDRGALPSATGSRGGRVCVLDSQTPSGALADDLAWTVVRSAPDADLALLQVGAAVGPRWYEKLRDAAYRDGVVATASAVRADALAVRTSAVESVVVATEGVGRTVALGEPLWGCVYVRRDALNVAMSVRWYEDGAHPVPLEKVVLVPGLVHVMAATVVVPSPEQPASQPPVSATPSVRRALAEIEAALEPLRVMIDLRCCASPMSGTQVHALNLVCALATRKDLTLSVLTPAHPHASARPHLDALPAVVTQHAEGTPISPRLQVFHRPFQLFEGEISDVVRPDVRLVVTHQDMINDRTPAYFPSKERWENYAAATALGFVAADEVVFFSKHAREEALRDGYLDRSKTSVVPPGTDHLVNRENDAVMPTALPSYVAAQQRPFLLFIGNSYLHKNRLFALRVVDELTRNHGWDGAIVCAGSRPRDGASVNEERAFLQYQPRLSSRYVDLGRVSDAELRWLYRNATLVVFPSLYEGFGLVPFEAAAAGTPCVYACRSSVGEYLPPEGALLDLSDVAESARRIASMLDGSLNRDEIVRAIRRAGESLTWSRTAEAYAGIYYRAITRPVGLTLVLGREVGVAARSEMASSQAERRLLLLLKRSRVVRGAAEAALTAAITVRRAVRRRR
jgi:glycosyltransferase involved in cell wall biosynthesis